MQVVETIIHLVNVALVVFVLFRVLRPMVIKMFHDRRTRILDEIEVAGKNKEEAQALKLKYEQALDNVAKEKQTILANARQAADAKTKEQLEEAENEIVALKSRTQKEIAMEQERAKSEMQQKVIGVSSSVAIKFLVNAIDEATHERLFNEAMAELEEIAWHN